MSGEKVTCTSMFSITVLVLFCCRISSTNLATEFEIMK